MYYEIFYYNCSKEDYEKGNFNGFTCFGVRTKKDALNYYNNYVSDNDKSGWFITKRNKQNDILQTIIG